MLFSIAVTCAGIFFAASYVLTVRKGFLDHTYGVPLVALGIWISWDIRSALGRYHAWVPIHAISAMSGAFVVLHFTVLWQVLGYGHREFPGVSLTVYRCGALLTVASTALVVPLIDSTLHDNWGIYSAIGAWLSAMAAYPLLLLNRKSLRGQSVSICIFQLLTSIANAIAFLGFMPASTGLRHSPLVAYICLISLALNGVYLWGVLVVRGKTSTHRAAGTGPVQPESFTSRAG